MSSTRSDTEIRESFYLKGYNAGLADAQAEIAELRKEITLLKVERDNANQHNSIMRQEAMERKRGIADMVEILESCKDAVDPYLVDCRKLDKLIINIKRRGDMPRIEQADKERRNIEAGAPPERLSKDFIIFQQSQQIAELVEMLERVNGTAMGFWRGNSVFSEIQELINKHKDNE